jgi:hypothetical protein
MALPPSRHAPCSWVPASAGMTSFSFPYSRVAQMWIGFPVTAIAASFTASEWVGWAWQV